MKMENYAVFLVVLVFVTIECVIAQQVDAKIDSPILIPSDIETILNAGDDFSLECRGNKPLSWKLPEITEESMMERNNISVSEDQEAPYYRSLLILYNVSSVDVGYYFCYFNTSDNFNIDPENEVEHFLDLERAGEAKSTYIYVDDPKNIIVSKDTFIPAMQYKKVTIPCVPSSPNVIVKLFQGPNEVLPYKVQEEFALRNVTYDRRLGFTFSEALTKDAGQPFDCVGEKDGVKHKNSFIVQITPYTSTVPQPQIVDQNDGKVVINERLELECLVRVIENIPFKLSWDHPNKKLKETQFNISTTKFKENQSQSPQKVGTSTLIIHNVSYEDAGVYKCIVEDSNRNINSVSKTISVLEKGVSYVKLREPANKHEIKISAGKPIKWIVKIDAYPKPIITWFDNKNKTITTNSRYEIITNEKVTETMMKINNVTLDDMGYYRVQGVSGKNSDSLNLHLTVESPPEVSLDVQQFYMYDSTENITCTVRGYPLPTVWWTFQECTDPTNCSVDKPLKAINYTIDDVTVKSVVRMQFGQSGNLTCYGRTSGRFDKIIKKSSGFFYVTDIENGFGVRNIDGIIAAGDNISLSCAASLFTHDDETLYWYKNSNKLTTTDRYILNTDFTQFSNVITLSISDISKHDNGKYECRSEKFGATIEHQEIVIDVKDVIVPYFDFTNMNNDDFKLTLGEPNVEFVCEAKGIPEPEVKWYKDGKLFDMNERTLFKQNNSILHFDYIKEEDEGLYQCVANSRVGKTERFIRTYLEQGKFKKVYIAIIVVLLILFIIPIAVLIYKIKKEKARQKKLSFKELLQFQQGAIGSLNPDLGLDEQAELLPYDKKWEFPCEKLYLGKQLGSGAFGVVMKAEAYGIVAEEESTTVAVKMAKKTADPAFMKALVSELKIMVHLGRHLNVVNLLGACTKNVTKRELLVIVEYCRFGNLHNYLLRHRDNFINQIDHTDNMDTSIGSEIINRAYSVSSNKSSYPHSGQKSVLQPLLSRSSVSRDDNTDGPTVNTANTVISMIPTGDDGPVTSSGSVQPDWRSNYKGDYNYNKEVRPISTQDLLGWSFQVARGMEYLASRKVLHGDLAARNILLADNNIVKICDFGLAKNMYKSDNYKKKGDGPLPVKWMAIESIRDRVFSTQSDVWSFGIVLWELFSLARTPYPGMEADEKFYNRLVEGYRMEKPVYSNKKIYNIMLECWRARPIQRPSFFDLAEQLGNLLEDGVRKHYIDLNDPYMDMNNRWLAERGDSDYLAMMCSPDYGNLTSATVKHEYVNDPFGGPTKVNPLSPEDTDAEGYLCMSPAKSGVINKSSVFSFPPANPPNRSNIGEDGEKDEQKNEWVPMLQVHNQSRRPGSDSDLGDSTPASPNFSEAPANGMPSYSNPTYTPIVNSNDDKYPNDLIIVNDKYHDTSIKDSGFCENMVDESISAFTNPSYVTMNSNYQKPQKNNLYANIPPNVVT